MGQSLVKNRDGPISLLLENKELYSGYSSSRHFFENGYFTTQLLRRMSEYISWNHVFLHDHIPREFVMENMEKRKETWNYPGLSFPLLEEKVKTTKSHTICQYILSNPALFSEGVEKARGAVALLQGRRLIATSAMVTALSSNVGAPLEFFIDNPHYISWDILLVNRGKVFRGDEEKTVSFLNSNFKAFSSSGYGDIVENPAIPLKFIEDNILKILSSNSLGILSKISENPHVTLSWWNIHMTGYDPAGMLLSFAGKPSTPYSFVTVNMSKYFPYERTAIQISYNAPVNDIIEMCEKVPEDDIDWDCIALNSGFWLHLAEKELTPVMKSVFMEAGLL